MTIRSSTAVIEELVQVYPNEVVLPQLKQLYREEINEAIGEATRLLPTYCARVDGRTSNRERAKLMLVEAYLHDDSMSLRSLEASLKYVLKRQKLFASASS